MSIKILTVVGARPQFIKAAAVSRAILASADFNEVLLHTGQHFDPQMSDVFFRELGIPTPTEQLHINGLTHGAMTGRMLEGIESAIQRHKPDWVLVYGDTNSTLAGALAAAKLHIPIAHVEAGLRSFNRRMPEEINRVLTDHVSSLLLTPTAAAAANLAAEGISRGVHHIGDVMYDAMLHAMNRSQDADLTCRLELESERFVLATVHRAENTDDPTRLQAVLDALIREASGRPIVMPIHPRTKLAITKTECDTSQIKLIDPVGYIDMAHLLNRCELVITDSGGLQKEAYFARRPCVTLRDETEWVETIEAGWNRPWTMPNWPHPRKDIHDYGTGDAASQVLQCIRDNSY